MLGADVVLRQLKQRLRSLQAKALAPVTELQSASLQATQRQLLVQYATLARTGGALPSLRDVGFRVFSDADEDGILLYLFALIGAPTRRLVDIGSAAMAGSNTANLLLHHGWTGLLIDADEESLHATMDFYARARAYPPLLTAQWVTAENVDGLLAAQGVTGDVDLLSIDIDGNDYWVWQAITVVSPRVVVIEYQDILGPDRSVTIPYDPEFRLDRFPVNARDNNYVGASLRALAKLGTAKGYRLVGCNRTGWNAFFVRADLGSDLLPEAAVADCFTHPWNEHGMRHRFPLVQGMPWVEV